MYLGIDIGTSSIKGVLGLKSGIHTITGHYNKDMFNGGIHGVEYFLQSIQSFLIKISKFSYDKNEKVEGIGLSGHGPSILFIDKNGTPVTDIITWQDSSAHKEAEELNSMVPGFVKDGTSYEAKLFKFFKENKRSFQEGTKVLSPKDYVIFLLTGKVVMDFATASTLSFFKEENRMFDTYSTEIPTYVFPEIVDSWEEAGRTGTDYSRNSGMSDDIPVIAGGIDAWCEALGSGAIEDGMMVDGSGTSTCITSCRLEGDSKLNHVIPGRSLVIETMSSTGASISWLMDLLDGGIEEVKNISSYIPVPVVYLPFLDGERSPVWDERASASFTGITSKNNRKDLIKSVLQGIAFGTRQCIQLVRKESNSRDLCIRAVGGGANNRAFLQFKANITGLKYISMKETDAAPLGAMILAAFSCGEESVEELVRKWVQINFEVKPDSKYKKIWDRMFSIYTDHYYKIKETSHKLFTLAQELEKYN